MKWVSHSAGVTKTAMRKATRRAALVMQWSFSMSMSRALLRMASPQRKFRFYENFRGDCRFEETPFVRPVAVIVITNAMKSTENEWVSRCDARHFTLVLNHIGVNQRRGFRACWLVMKSRCEGKRVERILPSLYKSTTQLM